MLSEQMGVSGAWRLRIARGGEHRAVWRRRGGGLSCHLLIGRQLQGCQETEVQHGGGVGVGSMVGQEADLSLSLLLLDSEFGSTVSVCTAAAEQDEDGPQQPEPPEFVVVGAAAGLSAAVSRLTQVSAVSVGTRAVPRSPQQGQAATGVVLHRTPASRTLNPEPPLPARRKPLTGC